MDSIFKIQEGVSSICNIPYKVVGENILELEARGVIERIPKTSLHQLRMKS
ncbi:MAG: hypothetical protein ABJN84_02110 [Flavobacteriaceae bacterium]